MVKSKQPQLIVGLDGVDIEQRREWFLASVVDAGADVIAFHPLFEVALLELHHWLCCAPLVPSMSTNQEKLHLRRGRFVLELLSEIGVTPMAQSKLGLRQAQELATRNQTVRPRRDRDHLQKVANILDGLGLLPPAEVVDADAEVVEPNNPEPVAEEPEYGDPSPPPLPEADRQSLGVPRSIFDRKL